MDAHNAPVYAAIDIGSNSFRLLIGTLNSHISVIKKELVTVRLAEGMSRSGLINENALDRATKALHLFLSHIDKFSVAGIRVCGTEALRRAKNNHTLCRLVQRILNTSLQIIDGTEEASLTQKGVFHGLPSWRTKNSLIVDVGGGSTESIYSHLQEFPPQSLPLGALTVTEQFFDSEPISLIQIKQATIHIQERMLSAIAPLAKFTPHVIGSGGTATSLSSLNLGLSEYNGKRVHDSYISQPALVSLFKSLTQLSYRERCLLPGLDEGRGKIILGGALIYCVLMDILKTTQLHISDYGLLEGIFLSLFPGRHLRA